MIVRIHQIPLANHDAHAGWNVIGLRSPAGARWPIRTGVFEISIREVDEQSASLAKPFRQAQMRQIIPEVIAALRPAGSEIVVRLDGPFAPGQLLDAFNHLTDPRGHGRFGISPILKFDESPAVPALASVRLLLNPARLTTLCQDPALGIDRSVRFWCFIVPKELVDPMLDIHDMSDERWAHVLPQTAVVISSVFGLESLQVITARYAAEEMKSRLLGQLANRARSAPRETASAAI